MFHVILIQQHEGDLLSEWPAEQCVILTAHDHKEDRDVRSLSHSIPIQVNVGAHFVAVATGVETRAIERDLLTRRLQA